MKKQRTTGVLRVSRLVLLSMLCLVLAALMAGAAVFADDDSGADVRTISSASDWNRFVISVRNGDTGGSWRLEKNISISSPVGTEANPFTGTFDGDGYTITCDISDTSAQGTAPFRHIAGATIKNVRVDGLITGVNHVAGLVGFADSGTNTIDDVQVDATINGGEYAGAVVGHAKKSTLIIRNGVFNGKLTGGTNFAGGFMGWSDGSTLKITDSIYCGKYTGDGQFDPVGVRSSYAECSVDISNVYTVDTAQPTITSKPNNLFAQPEIAYIESRLPDPENKLYKAFKIKGRNTGCYYECADASIGGLKEIYDYKGSVIDLGYKVLNGDTELTKGTDYKAYVKHGTDEQKTSADNVYEGGPYTFLAEGCGNYRGALNKKFYIIRFSAGDGSETNPYQIKTAQDWNTLAESAREGNATYSGKYLKLMNNITSGLTEPVGTSKTPFMGNFDGNGKTLTFSIDKTANEVDFTAPFAFVKSATIKNLNITGNIKGGMYTCGVVARTQGSRSDITTISGIKITAELTGKNSDDWGREGGVLGDAGSAGVKIENVVASPKFSMISTNKRYFVGGLIQNVNGGEVWLTNCIYSGSRTFNVYSWHPSICSSANASIHFDRTYWIASEKRDDWNGSNNNGFAAYTAYTKPSDKICTKVTAADGNIYYIDESISIQDLARTYKSTGQEIALGYKIKKTNKAAAADTGALTKGTDYAVNYEKVRNTGNYTLVVTGKGNYTGEISAKFSVIDQLQGAGTEDDPYLINNSDDWDLFARNVREFGHTYKGQYVKLNVNGITVTASNCVGTDTETFNGVFDGNGKELGLSISKSGTGSMAPFRSTDGATIKNLTVIGSVSGGIHSAGLIAQSRGSAETRIENVRVNVDVRGGAYIGGIVGHANDSTVNLKNSVYMGALTNTSSSGYTGGMVGWGGGVRMVVTNCLFIGTHSGEGKFHPYMFRDSGYGTMRGSTADGAYYVNGNGSPSDGIKWNECTMTSNISAVYLATDEVVKNANSLFKKLEINGRKYNAYKRVQTEVDLDPVFDYPISDGDVVPVVRGNGEVLAEFDSTTGTGDYSYSTTGPQDGKGIHTLTVMGKKDYTGTVTKEFKVIDLHKDGDNYHITSVDEWKDFCDSIYRGKPFEGKTVYLDNDLTIGTTSDTKTTDIMAGTETHPFTGRFDGGHHNLTLDLNWPDEEGVAPFRYISGATIWKVNTAGSVTGGRHSAGLVGFALDGENIIASVNVSATLKHGDYVGGVLGHGKSSKVSMNNVIFNGQIGYDNQLDDTASQYGGGLIGWCDGMTLDMDGCLYNGQWHGKGKIHPIALRNKGKKMNVTAKDVYYQKLNTGTVADKDYIAVDGVAAYPKNRCEEGTLWARADDIAILSGTNLYLPCTVQNESSYILESGSISPKPVVYTYGGTGLDEDEDYTVDYLLIKDSGNQGKSVIDEEGTYKMQLIATESDRMTGDYLTEPFEVIENSEPVSGISLDRDKIYLSFDHEGDHINDELQLTATVTPEKARSKNVSWSSENEEVATVSSSGLVKSVAEGTTTVTASVEDPDTHDIFTAECIVEVEKSEARINKAPEAIEGLVYNGEVQTLITAGEADHGSVVYRIGGDGEFSDEIPAVKEAGVYTVYYMAEGDSLHTDSDIAELDVAIAKAPFPGTVENSSLQMYRGGNTVDLYDDIDTDLDTSELVFKIESDSTGECSVNSNGVLTSGDSIGSCTVSVSVRGDDSYEAVVINVAILEKESVEFDIQLDDVTYGEAVNPEFDMLEDAQGFMEAYTGMQRNGEIYNSDTDAPTAAGEYTYIALYETNDTSYYGLVNFTIKPKDIADAEISLSKDEMDYDGSAKIVEVVSAELDGTDIKDFCDISGNSEVNAGDHAVTLTARDDTNYCGTASATYVIRTAEARVEAQGYSGAYDGNAHSISVNVENGEAADAKVYYSTTEELNIFNYEDGTLVPPERQAIGKTTVWFFVEVNDNYEAVPQAGSADIEILKKPFPGTVSIEEPWVVHGESLDISDLIKDVPEGTDLDYVLLEGADKGCVLDGSTLTAGDEICDAKIEVSVSGADKDKYEKRVINVSVTDREQRKISVTQDGAVYGAELADPEFSWDYENIERYKVTYSGTTRGGEEYSEEISEIGSEKPDVSGIKPAEAGEYKFTVVISTTEYQYTGSAEFTIAPQDISDADIVIDEEHNDTYDGTEKTKEAQKVMLGDTDIKEYCTITGDKAVNAGIKTIIATADEESNYSGTAMKEWILGKATTFISEAPEASAITYGQSLEACGLSGGAAVTGEGTAIEGSFEWVSPETVPEAGSTGTYVVSFKPDDPYNYRSSHVDTEYGDVKVQVEVSKADLTPTVKLADWPVKHDPNKPVVEGNDGNGEVTFTYKAAGADDSEYSGTVPTEIGSYIVRAQIAETDNYKAAVATAPFAITKDTELAKAKSAAIADLEKKYNPSKYSGAEKTKIKKLLSEAKAKINAAATVAEVASIKAAESAKMAKVKTDAKKAAEEKAKTAVGTKHKVNGSTYKVTKAATSSKAGKVAFVKARKGKKTVTIPATVKIRGKKFYVVKINAKAFKSRPTKTIIVKTKKLTKKSVKGSLKGSKVKTIKVKVGKKKLNKKYVKKYKMIFTKKNAGRKVNVRL